MKTSYLLTLLLLLSACGQKHEPDSKMPDPIVKAPEAVLQGSPWPKIVNEIALPDSYTKELERGVQVFYGAYHVPDSVVVKKFEYSSIVALQNGAKATTIAVGTSGTINITKEGLTTPVHLFFCTIVHELFHALQPKEATSRVPCILADGYKIIGYQGLTLLIKSPTDSAVLFTKIEEGAAEVCAALTNSNYQTTDPRYFSVGNLMLTLINKGWFTTSDLINFQRSNDITGFVSKVFNIERDFVSDQYLQYCMSAFAQTFSGEATASSAAAALEEYRK